MESYPQPGSRRGFLKKGLLGGFVLAFGGGAFLASRASKVRVLPKDGLRVLDSTEYSVLLAIAARLVPKSPGFPGAEEVAVGINSDRILLLADPAARKEVKQLLKLFENALAGFLFGGRTRPFTQLPSEEQDAVLREWQNSRLEVRRTGFQALRTLTNATYFGSPITWPAVHYPGPPEGFHQPDAPFWKGAGEKRPDGNGIYRAEVPDE